MKISLYWPPNSASRRSHIESADGIEKAGAPSLKTAPTPRLFSAVKMFAALLVLVLCGSPNAFPPAPHHLYYGMVRDEYGNPLNGESAEVILETIGGVRAHARIIPGLRPGVNYKLPVPMDAGATPDLYKPAALKRSVPFKIQVRIGSTIYLPIEMSADYASIGEPGQATRLNLTLGEDLDGNGIPDAWERAYGRENEGETGSGDEANHASELERYLAGIHLLDGEEGYSLRIVESDATAPVLEFMAVMGRSYSVYASADLSEWAPVRFRVLAEGAGAPVRNFHYATGLSLAHLELVLENSETPARFFRLKVE